MKMVQVVPRYSTPNNLWDVKEKIRFVLYEIWNIPLLQLSDCDGAV